MFDEVNKYCPSAYWYFTLSILVHVLILIGNILVGTFTWFSAIWFLCVFTLIYFFAKMINLLCVNKHQYIAWIISGLTMLSIIPGILITFVADVSFILHPKIKNMINPAATKKTYQPTHDL